MEIVIGYPPNIEMIKLVFPVDENTVFAWGDIIYAQQEDLRPDLIYHESIHRKQQAGNPEAWWNRYLTDVPFRLEQEIEAYWEQWQWIKKHTNAKIGKMAMQDFAKQLASPLYGFDITNYQAEAKLRKYAN